MKLVKQAQTVEVKQKLSRIFALSKITPADIQDLDHYERHELQKGLVAKLNHLKDVERDAFLEQTELVLSAGVKTSIWDYNHSVISNAVSDYMLEYGIMPTKNVIAKNTGLSRQAVARHFKEFITHPEFTAEHSQFELMTPRVLSNVYRQAIKGNIRAAKLYIETVGTKNKTSATTTVNSQNNYIQINNTILSQENLTRLTADQLNQIESIINNQRAC